MVDSESLKKVYIQHIQHKEVDGEIIHNNSLLYIVEFHFCFEAYLQTMSDLMDAYYSSKDESLMKLRSDLFDIANKVYFSKFYKEVSLEDKVRADGYSFDVSIFKPLKRSVLFN